MTHSFKAGHWCASALILLACSNGFARDGQNGLYLNAHAGGGTLDTETAKIDVEEFHIGAGFALTSQIHLEGGYSLVDFEGTESNLLSAAALYHHPLEANLSVYGKAGLNYWDSSDADETEAGYGVGFGMEWGGNNVRLTLGYDFLDNLENDAIFDDISIYSIGIKYYLGGAPGTYSTRGQNSRTSIESTTACDERHKDLFYMCDPDK